MGVKAPPMMVVDVPNQHYAVLGCHPRSSADELKRAYRRCVIESHPDKGGTPEKFQAVRLAAEVLCDEEKRVEYDVRSKLATRMRQITKDYDRSTAAGWGAGAHRRRASANARQRAEVERERERCERQTWEWRERAQSARHDQEQRWKKARARTAAFEEKWETAFQEFTAKREAEETAAAANAASAAANAAARASARAAAFGGRGGAAAAAAGQRRAFSARGPRKPTWGESTSRRAGTETGAKKEEKTTSAETDKEHEQREQQREQREGPGRAATVFTAPGRFECYHLNKSCRALLSACGFRAPAEHEFIFAARVERRRPCRFCCKEKDVAVAAAAATSGRGGMHRNGRPAPAATGARQTQRPRSALYERLPRRNFSGGSSDILKCNRPASASAFASASASAFASASASKASTSTGGGGGFGGGAGVGGGGDDISTEAGGSAPTTPAPVVRYAAPKGKLHHSSAACPCLVGRAGVRELPAAEVRGLRPCGTC